jgi:phosphoribosylanthranilate isomerase
MSLWIKICGNTSLADARMAVDAGADAVGFVFAPSPRRVTPQQVAEIVPSLPASMEKIGVFVDGGLATIAAAVEQCGLTGVQLHSAGGSELPAQLRERFGAGLRILRVIHFGDDAGRQMLRAGSDADIDGVLVDSRTATAVGGTGVAFDWKAARTTMWSAASNPRPGIRTRTKCGHSLPTPTLPSGSQSFTLYTENSHVFFWSSYAEVLPWRRRFLQPHLQRPIRDASAPTAAAMCLRL